ncbi:MAG TPA: hypothetical protein VGJ42_01955 [Nitrososphaera sp.]
MTFAGEKELEEHGAVDHNFAEEESSVLRKGGDDEGPQEVKGAVQEGSRSMILF